MIDRFNVNSKIRDVINESVFNGFGRMIFPVQKNYIQGAALGTMNLSWYSNIRPEETVEVVNYLYEKAASEKIFYDIYTDEEKAGDPAKNDTGLFFFRGRPGAKFAVLSAGGGFRYVGAIHDSFPHALALSKMGYNAFALIYRPGIETSDEDLARAVAFIFDNAEQLNVDVRDYSLWGGSAGGRMAARVGALGTGYFGERACPKPAAVIMQYSGLHDVYGGEPPTYCCVGSKDCWRAMRQRVESIRANGTDAEIEIFDGLAHGFGLGAGTCAEGWINRAADFWERHIRHEGISNDNAAVEQD